MPLITLATQLDGTSLVADCVIVGTRQEQHPTRGTLTLPVYEMISVGLVVDQLRQKNHKNSGMVYARLPEDIMGTTGRLLEVRNDKDALKNYVLTNRERQQFRSKVKSGLLGEYQLHWNRYIRGPASHSIEQSVTYEKNDAPANGSTFTITNPTSGNLLVICHNYYWGANPPNDPTSTGFTRRVTGGNAVNEPISALLDKDASGSEGTSITVTNGGTSEENSGNFLEISGMESSSYIASAGADSGTGNVTSHTTGSVTNTGKADALYIANWGSDGAPSSVGYAGGTDTFTAQASIFGDGGSDSNTHTATYVASTVAARTCGFTWTTGVVASSTLGAYAINVYTAPAVVVPTQATICANGEAFCSNTASQTVTGTGVTENTDTITSVVIAVTGGGTVTVTTSGSVTASGNGTATVTLQNGASEAEYDTVIGTAAYQGSGSTHGKLTVTITANDGTSSPNDSFYLLCEPRTLTVTRTGTWAQYQSDVATTQAKLDSGINSDNITFNFVDDDAQEDTQVLTMELPQPMTVFKRGSLVRRRKRRRKTHGAG